MQKRFADDEAAATNPAILIEAYTELAAACRKVGEDDEAKRYDERIQLLKNRK